MGSGVTTLLTLAPLMQWFTEDIIVKGGSITAPSATGTARATRRATAPCRGVSALSGLLWMNSITM